MKKLALLSIILLLALSLPVMSGPVNSAAPQSMMQNEPAELQARFEFNEGTGTTTKSESGTYSGEFIQNVQWVSEGVDGTALSFVDSGYVNTTYQGVLGTDQLSVSAWIRTDSTDNSILWWGKEDVKSKMELKIDGTGVFRAQIWGNAVLGTTNVADGQWHHVVCVVDSAGQIDLRYSKLYVDGKLDNEPRANNGNVHNIVNEANLQIGGLIPAYRWYHGFVDQVAVYKGSLTAEEVLTLYTEEHKRLVQPDYPAKMLAQFSLNEGAGTTISDNAGVYSGTFQYNVSWVNEGIDGSALAFTDSGYVDTDFAGVLGNNQLSVMAWIKTDTTNNSILWWGKEELKSKMELKIDNSGVFRAQIFGNRVLGTTNVADDQWHHVVCVVDAEAQKDLNYSKLYVDGKLDNVPAANNGNYHNIVNEANLQIGGLIPDHLWYHGLIDQIAVYGGSLTAAEVEVIYAEEKARLMTTSVQNNLPGQPLQYLLNQNYPNPFNPETNIHYELPEGGMVVLSIYNTLGQMVKQLINQYQPAGRYRIRLNASDLPGGVYFYRIKINNAFEKINKMVLIK